MKLDTILFNVTELKQFVRDKFKPIEISYTEKSENEHPMSGYNFNRTLKNEGEKFTIFGKAVLKLLIYENDGKFCSLLLLEAKVPSDFDAFVSNLGYPENMLPEHYIEGDYHFLAWRKSGFEVFINKVHSGEKSRYQFLASIFNMGLEKTHDMRGLGN